MIACKILIALFCSVSLTGCATSVLIPVGTKGSSSEQISATLMKPDGKGPFPAVVVLHGAGGLGMKSSESSRSWAQKLLGQNYVILIPDSYSSRGFPSGISFVHSPKRQEVGPFNRVKDVYAALAFLRTLEYVDGERVGLIGFSAGGTTVLASLAATQPIVDVPEKGFAAAVALYPFCGVELVDYYGVFEPRAPLFIFIGGKDDWTPAEPCRLLSESAKNAVNPIKIKIYPEAHHGFDSNSPTLYRPDRFNINSKDGRGATTGGNYEAWMDCVREVFTFFDKYLKPNA
jgi:dienelactone hydrolase